MGSYLGGTSSPKKMNSVTNSQPVSAGEPQRSLIKGRGQYYQQMPGLGNTMYSNNNQMATGVTATGSIPGTADIGAYNTHSSVYYSNNFGATGGGPRGHL